MAPINYSIIPGNLGEVWLGSSPTRFFTLTNGDVTFANNLETAGERIRRDTAQRDCSRTTNGVDRLSASTKWTIRARRLFIRPRAKDRPSA